MGLDERAELGNNLCGFVKTPNHFYITWDDWINRKIQLSAGCVLNNKHHKARWIWSTPPPSTALLFLPPLPLSVPLPASYLLNTIQSGIVSEMGSGAWQRQAGRQIKCWSLCWKWGRLNSGDFIERRTQRDITRDKKRTGIVICCCYMEIWVELIDDMHACVF